MVSARMWTFTVMRYFCTYFDINYLDRGIILYRSLEQHVPEFTLFILCMDDHTHAALSNLDFKNIVLVPLEELESSDPALLNAKANRSRIEYYFTCSPALPLYVLQNFLEVDLITYLDADLFFFSTPEPLFEEMGDSSVAIIGHRFAPHLMDRELYGVYNVGWVSFRRDEDATVCLCWWRERCLEWCYDRVEVGKFADQKYLDHWPSLFKGVRVLEHRGANLAAWNLANYSIKLTNDSIMIDDQNLIFFHFHGLKRVAPRVYDPFLRHYDLKVNHMPLVKKHIITPYIKAIETTKRMIGNLDKCMPTLQHGIRYERKIPTSSASLILALFGQWLRGELVIC